MRRGTLLAFHIKQPTRCRSPYTKQPDPAGSEKYWLRAPAQLLQIFGVGEWGVKAAGRDGGWEMRKKREVHHQPSKYIGEHIISEPTYFHYIGESVSWQGCLAVRRSQSNVVQPARSFAKPHASAARPTFFFASLALTAYLQRCTSSIGC